ncbi:unnamed protein product [Blepharisma stoltei]|uniref:Aurora kinase n=1 Tax=Blepharisma stoltei TaxID=1481888 RepID=A0AAU9J3E1_9CILI|nr:unnamed protein product [Blepharisma stoltei]
MECCNPECSNLSSDTIVCRNCCMTRYCSEECLKIDWELNHSKHCQPHVYSLEDLQIVSNHNSSKLGRGSYGEVRLIFTKKGEKLALKSISKNLIETKIPLKILYREISVHRSLCHRNIIKLYDHLEDSSNIYLVLEYAEHGNLFTHIKRKKKLTEPEAWNFFTQVCIGINYLHEQQVIHRDIKPENILLGIDNLVKICDFGWCACGAEERSTFCGTLDYMAPEVLNLDRYSYEVDIWALGILLYEMLHGYAPFRAKSDRAKCKLILDKTFIFGPGITDEAKNLISSLLTDANSRPTVKDILKHDWIRKYTHNAIEEGYLVNHPEFGDGIISGIRGLICEVEFGIFLKEFVINDLVEICTIKEFKEQEDYRISASGIGLPKSVKENKDKIEEKKENKKEEYENLEISDSALEMKIKELNQLKFILEAPIIRHKKKADSMNQSVIDSLLSSFSCVKR